MNRYWLGFVIMSSTGALSGSEVPSQVVLDVRAFGAVGDGKTHDTRAIQKAIDAAGEAGQGTVLLSGGTFLSGTLDMKSHVTLRIDRGAVLLGSPYRAHYRRNRWYALLLAKDQENITLCGSGVIDGQGQQLAADVAQMVAEGKLDDPMRNRRPGESNRPQLIEFTDCRNVRVEGITLKDSSCWVQAYGNCTDLAIERVTVRSTAYWNNDGLDIVDCRRVRVAHCDINSADDGICLKSDALRRVCEDVLIEDCKVRSSGSALKLGTSSRGGFRRIKVRGLDITDTFRSAVAIETVDGGMIDDVDISGIRAKNTGNAIFIRLGHRNRDGEAGAIKNLTISDLTVEVSEGRPDRGYPFPGPEPGERHNLIPSSIVGLPGHPVVGVTLKHITIICGGGGRRDWAWIPRDALFDVPERASRYPEFSMFGELQAWGLYCRHVDGLILENITLGLKKGDDRSALVFDDGVEVRLQGIHVPFYTAEPVILLNDVHRATIIDCVSKPGVTLSVVEQPE